MATIFGSSGGQVLSSASTVPNGYFAFVPANKVYVVIRAVSTGGSTYDIIAAEFTTGQGATNPGPGQAALLQFVALGDPNNL